MRLSRIYASEIYVTSTRKDRIHAAVNNPFNAELVQQLSDYLDDDAKEELNTAIEEQQEIEELESTETEVQENADTATSGEDSEETFPDAEHNAFSPEHSSKSDSAEPNIFDAPEGEASESEPSKEADVEESISITAQPITADTDIDDVIFDIANQAEIIKGTLNSRQDTAGVQRINIDDKELWIYYKDEVNIGDIMINVIEALNGIDYTYLAFSRLARSNNAIVFDINLNLQEPVKTIKEIGENK